MPEYNESSPTSIEDFGKRISDKAFRDIIVESPHFISEEKGTYEVLKKNKGNLGQLVEKYHFGYAPNSDAAPDFEEAGVELKVTPYYRKKNGGYSAKERLVLNIINYHSIVEETFEKSAFWRKNSLLLLVHYFYEKELEQLDYQIKNVQLFQFPKKDIKIIREDWERIKSKVVEGKAHELSERDTNYLSACTKGSTSEKSMRSQPFSEKPAKQRAFSLKGSYMTFILNDYILKKKSTFDPSIYEETSDLSLEDHIIDRFEKYFGKTERELLENLGIDDERKPKNIKALIAGRIFNENLNDLAKAEEIQKADIKVKTIRVQKNGRVRESMSFPKFDYLDLVEQKWAESDLRNMFLEKKFLFIIFQEKEDGEFFLEDAKFWTIPDYDLEEHVRKVWEDTVEMIRTDDTGNLPAKSDSNYKVAHVRPHGRDKKDTLPLPSGREEVKRCFWLNNDYILEQIN
ncbi:Sau3AI family type II restriction endonuclease [Salimicrobium album]|uniref:DNA mismatch repair protein MutH n=1 Tax=Salimicrobium album TaxID=50717 RepID=A0A1H3E3N2_9BACI|nr:Sau3AI family type II restriction endonuclease [Salimicrobium album]SDX73275.1 DNA mismatch repair protein MutH [Salimicrobium album]